MHPCFRLLFSFHALNFWPSRINLFTVHYFISSDSYIIFFLCRLNCFRTNRFWLCNTNLLGSCIIFNWLLLSCLLCSLLWWFLYRLNWRLWCRVRCVGVGVGSGVGVELQCNEAFVKICCYDQYLFYSLYWPVVSKASGSSGIMNVQII